MASLKQFDPTGLYSQRRAFLRDIARRFVAFNKALRKLFVEDNAFGLTTNARYQFLTDPQKTKAFEDWLKEQVKNRLIVSADPNKPWTSEYIESAYRKAVIDSYTEVNDLGAVPDLGMSRKEFLQKAFSSKTSVRQLEKLYKRSFNGMKDITSTMSKKMTKILATALVEGKNPRQIVKQLSEEVGMTRRRAERIARTELIYSYAEGQLDTFEKLNVEELGVQSEWLTAGDGRVCPRCAERAGSRYTIEEARGLIPFHPNCRCAWIPHVPLPGSTSKRSGRLKRPSNDPRPSKRSKAKPERLGAPAPTLFNQQPTAVIRWMQQDGWTFDDIKRVLADRGVDINDATIRTQMSRARSGQAGAALSPEQEAMLRGWKIAPPPLVTTTTTSTTTPRPSTTTTTTTTSTTTPRPIIITTTTSTTTPRPRPIVDVKAIPYSKTQWVRALQQEGYSFQEIKQFMQDNGLEVADGTIRKQMGDAKKGIGRVEIGSDLSAYLRYRKSGGIGPSPSVTVTSTSTTTTANPSRRPVRGSKPPHITYSGQETDLHREIWAVLRSRPLEDEEQAIKIGDLVYKEAVKKLDPTLVKNAETFQETHKNLAKARAEWTELNKTIGTSVENGMTPKQLEERSAKLDKLYTAYSKAIDEHSKSNDAFGPSERARYAKELNGSLIETMGKLRDFGGEEVESLAKKTRNMPGSSNPASFDGLKEIFTKEAAKLPKDWLKEIDERVNVVELGTAARGYHYGFNTTTTLVVSGAKKDWASVMLHEIGHMVQERTYSASGGKNSRGGPKMSLSMIERMWRRSRAVASAEGLVESTIYQGTDEKGYRDEFTDHYIGKTYTGNWASEVLTMGLQGLFHNEHNITTHDSNMTKFIVGLLVGY